MRNLSIVILTGLLAAVPVAGARAQGTPMQLGPAGASSAPKAAPAPAATPATPASASAATQQPKPSVERVNAYFNGIVGLTADFIQIGPDGRRWDGKLHILRPGKMRFEYKPPSPLEIVSDGRSVAVRDRKANTQDLYLVGQTPLKFLLRDKIDVARDSKVISVSQQGTDAVLVIEDRQTVGGTSRIRLTFNNADMALKQWIVTDPQGYDTRVQLSNVDLSKRPSPSLFLIQEGNIQTPN